MSELPRHIVVVLLCIRRDDAILLVKQNYEPEYWSLPGGLVELGESIEEAAVREAREETGLRVCIKRVIGLYSKPSEGPWQSLLRPTWWEVAFPRRAMMCRNVATPP